MDLEGRIEEALIAKLDCEYVQLQDEEGITGVAVSTRFEGVPAIERQRMIDEALGHGAFSREEARRVLMIAAMTPTEYHAVGPKIRIHRVREIPNGIEVLLQGRLADAGYVRETLSHAKGIKTTEPKQNEAAAGLLLSFSAVGTKEVPLTRDKAMRMLKRDRYIEVLPTA